MSGLNAITRRELLIGGAGLAGTVLVAGFAGFRVFASPGDAHLVRASWAPLVGTDVRVGGTSLRLVRIRDLGPQRYGNRLLTGSQHFALDFAGPLDAPLSSSLHTVEHPLLGRFQMFLSPVSKPGSVLTYEAIINRFDINLGRNNNVYTIPR